jgi:hypothetical protein
MEIWSVKNVLNFNKPSRWAIAAAVMLVAALSACLAVDRAPAPAPEPPMVPGGSDGIETQEVEDASSESPEIKLTVTPEPEPNNESVPAVELKPNGGYDPTGGLTDFTAMSDTELIQYAAYSDGAYSEGAAYNLAKRLDADWLSLLQALAAEEIPGVDYVRRMSVCRLLAGEYFIDGRLDDLEYQLDNWDAMSRPAQVDIELRRVSRLVEAIRFQANVLDESQATDWTPEDHALTVPFEDASTGLKYEITNVQSVRRGAIFIDGLEMVEYIEYNIYQGAEIRVAQAGAEGAEGAAPVFRLNYGYELGNDGNTLIDGPMTVEITKDLEGIISREGGYPLARFQHHWQ